MAFDCTDATESVSGDVVDALDVLNVGGEFSQRCRVARFSGRVTGIRRPGCVGKRLLIREDHEGSSLQKGTEVLDSEVSCKKLPTEGTILLFGRRWFLREETDRMPLAVFALLQHTSNRGAGGINQHARGGVVFWVSQEHGECETLLDGGGSEGNTSSIGPAQRR